MSTRPEAAIFEALKSAVDNRCYPIVFPQQPKLPVWPAIRYTRISATPVITLEGDGGDETADSDFQIDLVALNNAQLVALRAEVMARMKAILDPVQPVWTGESAEYDFETKTHRCRLDYTFYPSSGDGNSPPD